MEGMHYDTLWSGTVHKEELVNLHKILFEVKDYFEEINPDLKFSQVQCVKDYPVPDAQEQTRA